MPDTRTVRTATPENRAAAVRDVSSTRSTGRSFPMVLEWGPRAAGLTAIAVGGAYVAAWWVGAAARWSSAVITMKTNMAFSLVMAGTALVLVEPRKTTRARRAVGTVLAATVLLVGVVTLLEHVFHADLGIDQLLATEPPGAVATARPNRMGLPGSVSLALLGAGLLALARRRGVAAYFGLATAVVVLVPAVGFIADLVQFYGRAVGGIAWMTVITLLLLSAGLHLAEAPEGLPGLVWRDEPGSKVVRQLLPAAVLAPLVLQVLQRLGARHGLYHHDTGVGILLIGSIMAMAALLLRSGWRLNAEAAHAYEAEAEARWRAELLDLVHDAVLVWSPTQGIEAWTQGAQELYGYTAHETVGRDPHALLRTDASRPLVEIEEEVRRGGRWEGELRHRTKDGLEVVVSSKLRLVRGADGRERVLEVNRDITGRKRMEEELRASSRAKDEFLNLVSHELRNPLAPITNSLYLLEHAEPTGQQARRAKEVIGRQVGHLARLVEDLLEVTRISRGKFQLRRARLDLAELVRRTGEDHRDLLAERGLTFDVHTPDLPLWVDGDGTRLAQVVGNLLHNAAKFTPSGGRVMLSVLAAGEAAEVHVADTGRGIDPGLIGRIFEPFVQAEQTLARTDGGLGLGLALVKDMTELHGGSVEARSDGKGRGSEFVVRLPTIQAPAPGSADVSRAREPHRNLRVLVVDDNADAAESLADLVRMHGHHVEVALDGPTALQKAAAVVPDLVLLDIGMPGMSGYDVARALRARPALRSTRLVAVSGYAQAEDVQRAEDAGFCGYIAKPPDPKALERLLGAA